MILGDYAVRKYSLIFLLTSCASQLLETGILAALSAKLQSAKDLMPSSTEFISRCAIRKRLAANMHLAVTLG